MSEPDFSREPRRNAESLFEAGDRVVAVGATEEAVAEAAGERSGGDEVVFVALRWSLAAIGVLAAVAALWWLLRAPEVGELPPDLKIPLASFMEDSLSRPEAPALPFTDISSTAGIDFVHFNGAAGERLMPENLGGGCAFLDYDNDGHQDILLINGGVLPGGDSEGEQPTPSRVAPAHTMALYQNDGRGYFRNVTAGSGLDVSFYGMGVACGDYDGDGRTDIFITALGPNHLFRNLGAGRFEDVTAKTGVAGEPNRWSVSAAFLDYDNDGRLDLFVCNYVDWSAELDRKISYNSLGLRDYLPPGLVKGTQNYQYRNNGDGTFTDVSKQAGIHVTNPTSGTPKGKALGVVVCDLDEDGWQDIVVANDTVQGFLFHNQRNGTFREIGEAAGIGNNAFGLPNDGMGIDMGHLHFDERVTIAVDNLAGKASTAMFVSQGNPLRFTDEVRSMGIAAETQRYSAWGLFFFDCDLDGRLDLFQASGNILCEECAKLVAEPYLQPSQLYWNCGADLPMLLTPLPPEKRSPALVRPLMGRGAAYADIDGDGDLDILICQNARPAVLLRNDQETGNHWIRLKLVGAGHNREAIGARIAVRVGGHVLRRRVHPARSYLSQVELPVTIGLGKHDRPDEVRVIWPDGTMEFVSDVKVDGLTTVAQRTKKP